MQTSPSSGAATHCLRFHSLFRPGCGFVFPCDAQGHVDLDALGVRALNNYLYARTVIGRELAMPEVEVVAPH